MDCSSLVERTDICFSFKCSSLVKTHPSNFSFPFLWVSFKRIWLRILIRTNKYSWENWALRKSLDDWKSRIIKVWIMQVWVYIFCGIVWKNYVSFSRITCIFLIYTLVYSRKQCTFIFHITNPYWPSLSSQDCRILALFIFCPFMDPN